MNCLLLRLLSIIILCGIAHAENEDDVGDKQSPAQVEKQVLRLLNDGKQSDAEELLEQYADEYDDNQNIVFLRAACLRSRFQVADSFPVFAAAAKLGEDTPRGKCATLTRRLDAQSDSDESFAALKRLVKANPDDIMIRWMLAVQCRAYDKDNEGVKHYRKILEKWNPGPVLVHQTYGNLLNRLGRHKEALVERRIAVKLEPAGWSYQGLGGTLASLNRFSEANEAYQIAVEFAPNRPNYWITWTISLVKQWNRTPAIDQFKKRIDKDPKAFGAWAGWGMCLEMTGDKPGALEKYETAMKLVPACKTISNRIAVLKKELQKQAAPEAASPSDNSN